MNNTEFFESYDLKDTGITSFYLYCDEDHFSLTVKGDLGPGEKEYRRYTLVFHGCVSDGSEKKLESSEDLILKDIKITGKDKEYGVSMKISAGGSITDLHLKCTWFTARSLRYRGVDYTNVYGTKEYEENFAKAGYAESEEFFVKEEETELPDGFTLSVKKYRDGDKKVLRTSFNRCELRKDGKCIYRYASIDAHHAPFKEFILHGNGHRYYPFNIGLYGISYIDIDTLEVYNYVPRGYDNDYGSPCGESFIVTDIHYDATSDLIAYGGCYWAGLYDVMVGRFDSPLEFDPHLVSIRDIIDPGNDNGWEIDFVLWDENGLTVKINDGEEKTFSPKELNEKITVLADSK